MSWHFQFVLFTDGNEFRELESQRSKMRFDLKTDLVFERLDSSVFKRKKAVSDQAGKLHRMLMSLLFRKPELLAHRALPKLYPSNNRIACFSLLNLFMIIFGKIVRFSAVHHHPLGSRYGCSGPLSDSAGFLKTKIFPLIIHGLTNDHMIEHLDL